jgi:hypothetical protein
MILGNKKVPIATNKQNIKLNGPKNHPIAQSII